MCHDGGNEDADSGVAPPVRRRPLDLRDRPWPQTRRRRGEASELHRVERDESGLPRSPARSSKAGAQRWRWLGGCRPCPSPPPGGRPPPFRSTGRRALALRSAPPLRPVFHYALAHRRFTPPAAARSHATSADRRSAPLAAARLFRACSTPAPRQRRLRLRGAATWTPTHSPTSRGRWSAPRPTRSGTRSGTLVARTQQSSDDH
ncbi:hypothetical protein OsJ_33410 [Oryza sativa Japonica Group]|uniref:Uncharacterized protein n=1 Tax=Oryza sativa subsp. japonica TaxID=39947 RepID=B9GA14_ORYSJ|nr:hypothetical protein OsJ_33410 [Oryza sativa Japonica Group]